MFNPLLQHLRCNPDDEPAWTVLADQLLQNNDSRGRLVQLEQDWPSFRSEFHDDALTTHQRAMTEVLDSLGRFDGTIRRGFLVGLTFRDGLHAEVVADRLTRHPLLRELRAYEFDDAAFDALERVPGIEALDSFDVTLTEGVNPMKLARFFDRVRPSTLHLSMPEAVRKAMLEVAGATFWSGLERLDLSSDVDDPLLLSVLERTDIRPRQLQVRAGDATLSALRGAVLSRCERLAIRQFGTEAAWNAFWQSPPDHFRPSSVWAFTHSPTEARAVVTAPHLGDLRELDIAGLRESGVRALGERRWPHLECLHLNGAQLSVEEARGLAHSSGWPRLRSVTVTGSAPEDQALVLCALAEGFAHVDWVSADDSYVDGEPQISEELMNLQVELLTFAPNWINATHRVVDASCYVRAYSTDRSETRVVADSPYALLRGLFVGGRMGVKQPGQPVVWVAGDLDVADSADKAALVRRLPPLRSPRLRPGEVTADPALLSVGTSPSALLRKLPGPIYRYGRTRYSTNSGSSLWNSETIRPWSPSPVRRQVRMGWPWI
ncbi:MAG: hypothetical protein AAGA48_14435 [Myxococcota bacterium]